MMEKDSLYNYNSGIIFAYDRLKQVTSVKPLTCSLYVSHPYQLLEMMKTMKTLV